jgi:hypothetical protein
MATIRLVMPSSLPIEGLVAQVTKDILGKRPLKNGKPVYMVMKFSSV